IGEDAAAVRNDEPDPVEAFEHPIEQEIGQHPRGVERIFQNWRRKAETEGLETGRLGRMNKHGRAALVQLRHDGIKHRIAEVAAGKVAVERNAVEAVLVEREAKLAQRSINIRQWQD